MSDILNTPQLEKIRKWRQLVLLAEIAGWLHDWGKLSKDFIHKHTIDDSDETKDKHENIFTSDDEKLAGIKIFIDSFLTGDNGLVKAPTGLLSNHMTIRKLIENHGLNWGKQLKDENKEFIHILRLLIIADKMESAEDENNASARQSKPVFFSSPFGVEKQLDDIEQLDDKRIESYKEITPLIKKIQDIGFVSGEPKLRRDLWDCLQKKMRLGVGKTMRAVNDVRLDRHVWGVSSRFKAFVLRELLAQEAAGGSLKTDIGEYSKMFCLLSIQWNYWELVTPFSRLVDLMARQQLVGRVQDALTNLIEYEYALGNCIYRDDNGIHFMMADIPSETGGSEPTWQDELRAILFKEIDDISHGEFQPVILFESTEYVTRLPAQMEKARRMLPEIHPPTWAQEWQNKSSIEICQVCHKRPVKEQQKICSECATLREKCIGVRKGKWIVENNKPGETPWLGEIAGAGGKVAMLVARIGLEHWLDGDMLYSLFSITPEDLRTQKQGLSSLSVNASWKKLQDYLSDTDDKNDCKQILSEIAKVHPEFEKWIHKYHDREEILIDTVTNIRKSNLSINTYETILLAMTRKNPTAGRLLSIWQETETFLESLGEDLTEHVQHRRRIVLKLVDRKDLKPGIFRIALPVVGEIEVFLREDGVLQTITHITDVMLEEFAASFASWPGKRFVLYPEESKKNQKGVEKQLQIAVDMFEAYYPCETITGSPNLMMAFVPAEHALDVADKWRRAYQQQFGKVQNRLPFSIGVIFMDEHYPMFAAMDAARRLVKSFDAIDGIEQVARVSVVTPPGNGKPGIYRLHLASQRFGDFTWDVPCDLAGGSTTDWYYPYVKLKDGVVSDERSMSINTPLGCWVHISNVRPGDEICFYPGLFDFIHLDNISRRLDAALSVGDVDRRRHPFLEETKSTRPFILQNMEQLAKIWESIQCTKDISESRYHAVTSLLAMKREPWSQHKTAYRQLVSNLVTLDFDQNKTIEKAIEDGTYFDVFELYRQILKQPVECPSNNA